MDRDKKGRGGDGGSMMKKLTGCVRREKNPAHKLTTWKVYQIEAIYNDGRGMSVAYLAKKFGVCKTTIYNILRKRNWHYEL